MASPVIAALAARNEVQQGNRGVLSPVVDALTGGPSWVDQAQQLEAARQAGASPGELMQMASGLLGGFGGAIKAFHGSPHVFDAFDAAKIGTGEGAQAYGHGMYFAESPKVAAGYQERLTPGMQTGQTTGQSLADRILRATGGDKAATLEELDRRLASVDQRAVEDPSSVYDPEGFRKKIADAKAHVMGGTAQGALYEVNLAPNPEDMLHWDKPLSEQSPGVREAFQKVYDAAVSKVPNGESYRLGFSQGEQERVGLGQGYRDLTWMLGSPEAASAALRDAGIPGIRYLDAGSRRPSRYGSVNYQKDLDYLNMALANAKHQGAPTAELEGAVQAHQKLLADALKSEQGTHNIVLFDPTQAQILSRNGQPVAPPSGIQEYRVPSWRSTRESSFPIATNPSRGDLQKLALADQQTSALPGEGHVRVLTDPNSGMTYAWPANQALHTDVQQLLGLRSLGASNVIPASEIGKWQPVAQALMGRDQQ